MAKKQAWSVRTFQAGQDDAGVVKLLGQVATFDGSLAALSPEMLAARLGHPSARSGSAWQVAVANNGGVIGALMVYFTGTVRCEVVVGDALLEHGPRLRVQRAPLDRCDQGVEVSGLEVHSKIATGLR